MAFEVHIPQDLKFADYMAVVQTSRVLADGFDKKDGELIRAALAPEVIADYAAVKPHWTSKKYTAEDFVDEWLGPNHLGSSAAMVTFHLLGMPYFTKVTADEIVVNYQQLASHARRAAGEDWSHPQCKIEGDSDGKSWMEQTFVKVDGLWKISVLRPSIHYRPGSLEQIGRPDHATS